MRLHRFHIFLIAESQWRMFPMTKSAARFRQKKRKEFEKYMRDTAPAKYYDLLIPKFDLGCKVRYIFPHICMCFPCLISSPAPYLRLWIPRLPPQGQRPPDRCQNRGDRLERSQDQQRLYSSRRHRVGYRIQDQFDGVPRYPRP